MEQLILKPVMKGEYGAEIASNGAILLGENVVCDAHAKRPLRTTTHAHSDHILGIGKSVAECELVIATPATRDLIGVLKGAKLAQAIKALDYENSIVYGGEKITLFPANHIIGSAQVLVEDAQGRRIVYTGDFKLPGAPIIPSDVLVIEATYGNPEHVRNFKETVKSKLADLVRRALQQGPVYIFGYHGKLQEVIRILNDNGVDLPIIVPEKVFATVAICNKYGMKLRGCFSSQSKEGFQIRRVPHIGVYHVGASKYVGQEATRIFLSGWEFESPIRQTGERQYQVALSDHSDFEQLLQYVEESQPSFVITDNHRVGDARALAREIKTRFGIEAVSMP